MIWLLLALLVGTLLFLWLFYIRLRHIIRQRRRRAIGKPFRLTRSVVAVTVILGILTGICASGLAASCVHYRRRGGASTPPQETPPAISEDSQSPSVLPTSTPVRAWQDIFPVFLLSEVENSSMLTLADTLILGDPMNADLLSTVAERFDNFLAQHSHPIVFFPFYPNLASYFPAGEAVVYAFDNVSSLDQCDAQLRGVGEELAVCKANNQSDLIPRYCYHLSIRATDAMLFTKYSGPESQPEEAIWLYAELSFAALINEYIYDPPQGLDRSDWYYRLAVVYDYLGGIADTEELQLKMYFLSAAFLCQAFDILEEQGIQPHPNTCGHEIWDLCAEMLYRVAVRGETSAVSGFFQEIQQLEATIQDQELPDEITAETARILKTLELYQNWREQHG